MTTRVYAAVPWAGLRELVEAHREMVRLGRPRWNAARGRGYAVTDALRQALPDLDDEALEHYAMTEAAQASLELLHDQGEPTRRLVLAIDVDEAEPLPGGLCEVEAEYSVPHDVVAWLVDTDDAADAVHRVAGLLPLSGGESAQELERIERGVEACLEHELAWYAATEVDEVVALR